MPPIRSNNKLDFSTGDKALGYQGVVHFSAFYTAGIIAGIMVEIETGALLEDIAGVEHKKPAVLPAVLFSSTRLGKDPLEF
ncbi:hypothetical protein C1X05_10410 [Laceyella sacchari]|jgi:hypothetical protein|uniref:Uncharacterized protein n=1 Tax=Laceyella tengchongensis TaxID=574699 RepID=A0AA45WKQ3_9BACL|nr:hypothetical protein [Laceyella tengchongensis]AUS09194.1 hypothetical protein C1X05_10410 [Laceyella sacchari]SMP08540.1 hypothetical protein SAMN06265361_10236 [Laceyella tengchongensis]